MDGLSETRLPSHGTGEGREDEQAIEEEQQVNVGSSPWLLLRRYGVLITFGAVFLVFAILSPSSFLTLRNLTNIFSTSSLVIVVACGLTVPLLMNDFDLSVVGLIGFAGAVAVVMQAFYGWPWLAAVLLALVVGVLAGILHGLLIAVLSGSSFVITLATSSIFLGLSSWVQQDRTIYRGMDPEFLLLGQSSLFGIRSTIIFALIVVLILHVLVSKTTPGRRMLAIGENREAARLVGIGVVRLRMTGLVISGGAAALTGVLVFARAGQTYANAGAPFLLPAFAAVFLGSALGGRGRFTVLGTAAAVVLLQMVSTGLIINQVPGWTSNVFAGMVLAAAILIAPRGGRY